MSPAAIFKLLKAAKEVRDYVKKPNNLDLQGDMFLNQIKKINKKLDDFDQRLKKLEKAKTKKVTTEDAMYASLKKEIQKIKNAGK